MFRAFISIIAALAIFAVGSAMVTESSAAKGRAPGVYGKKAASNSSASGKSAKSTGTVGGQITESSSSSAGSTQTPPSK